jgi:hypothetical protein
MRRFDRVDPVLLGWSSDQSVSALKVEPKGYDRSPSMWIPDATVASVRVPKMALG